MKAALRTLTLRLGQVFRDESSWMEFSSGTTCAAWAIAALAVDPTLDRWPSMSVVTDLMPGPIWLIQSLCLGLFQLSALLWRQNMLRWIAAFVTSSWWSLMAYCVWLAVGPTPQILVYLGWVVPNCLAVAKHSFSIVAGGKRHASG